MANKEYSYTLLYLDHVRLKHFLLYFASLLTFSRRNASLMYGSHLVLLLPINDHKFT